MSDNTMPERITLRDERHRPVEFIRADALRTKLGGYHDSDLLSLAESLRTFHDNAEATMEKMQAQLAERDAKIAELEAALNDCRFVITELKTRLAEEGRDAINQKLIEKDYELRTTRSGLLERISMLLAEREWMPVSEGLPKMYTTVYVTVRTPQGENDIDFAFMTQAGWSYYLSPRNGTVTHWMPLPPPPVTDVTPDA